MKRQELPSTVPTALRTLVLSGFSSPIPPTLLNASAREGARVEILAGGGWFFSLAFQTLFTFTPKTPTLPYLNYKPSHSYFFNPGIALLTRKKILRERRKFWSRDFNLPPFSNLFTTLLFFLNSQMTVKDVYNKFYGLIQRVKADSSLYHLLVELDMEELKTFSPEQLGELLLNDPSWTVMRAMFNDDELQILNETILEEDTVGDAKEILVALGRPCSLLPTVSIAAYINTFKGESDTDVAKIHAKLLSTLNPLFTGTQYAMWDTPVTAAENSNTPSSSSHCPEIDMLAAEKVQQDIDKNFLHLQGLTEKAKEDPAQQVHLVNFPWDKIRLFSSGHLGALLLQDPTWLAMRIVMTTDEMKFLQEIVFDTGTSKSNEETVSAVSRPLSMLPLWAIAAYIDAFKGANVTNTAQVFEKLRSTLLFFFYQRK